MPPKKKTKRARTDRAPSHDELHKLRETEALFKSNLFRLQTTELLKEASPAYGSAPLQGLEAWVRGLRQALLQLPEAELSWERTASGASCSHEHLAPLRLHGAKVALGWRPPAKIELVGSYLLRTVARPALNLDVTVQIPAACLLEKDYLDNRYVDKRLLYLAHLGATLRAAAAAGKVGGVVLDPSSIKFASLPHMPDPDWPVLQLGARAAAAGAPAGAGEEWTIRLIPSLDGAALAASKMRPGRANLRASGGGAAGGGTAGGGTAGGGTPADAPAVVPSAEYNNRLCLESRYGASLALLHSHLSTDANGVVMEAAILLKTWARQRSVGQAGGISGFQLTLLLLHLLKTRKLSLHMGSYHIFRVALRFLASTDLSQHPIVLPAARDIHQAHPAEADPAKEGGEDEEEMGSAARAHAAAAARAAADAKAAEAAALFAPHFAWVLLDSEGCVNYGAGVGAGALQELRAQAGLSLALLDASSIDDAEAFAQLFTAPQPPPLRYDAVLALHDLPALASAPSAAALAAEVEALLRQGLADRASLVRVWLEPPRVGTHAPAARGRMMHVGLELDAEKALRLVDRGPAASEAAKLPAWGTLWGDKSQARRFKDGAIVHAVVWESAPEARHTIVLQMVRHLLQRHHAIAPARVRCALSGCDAALAAPPGHAIGGLSHTSASAIVRAFDSVAVAMRGLTGLPLMLLNIHPAAASFCHCEPFPPAPTNQGAPPPAGSAPLRFVMQFESSGKWPSELEAVGALKAAFYLKMAAQLEESASIHAEASRHALYVQCDGFTFVGTIQHDQELALLRASGRPAAAAALRRATVLAPRHTAAMSSLAAQYPAFGATVRLCRRWAHAHLLSAALPAELVDLLVAHVFTSPAARPPATALLGLLRFLQLLQRHDFAVEPLLLGLEAPLSAEAKAAARAAFERARASPGGGPALYIATDVEPEGGEPDATRLAAADGDDADEAGGGGGGAGCLRASSWATAERPTPLLARRARGLAAAAARVLLDALSPPSGGGEAAAAAAATSEEADAAVAAAMLPAFLPALQEFDALLELEPRRLPRRAMQLGAGGKAAAPPQAKAFANLQHGRIASGVGDDAVAALVARLEARHGSLALFFFDELGGAQIAIKWRPRCFLPAPWRPAEAQGRLLLSRAAPPEAPAGKKGATILEAPSWLLPDVSALLEDMCAMSDGLVRRARLVQAAPALRR